MALPQNATSKKSSSASQSNPLNANTKQRRELFVGYCRVLAGIVMNNSQAQQPQNPAQAIPNPVNAVVQPPPSLQR